MSKKIILIIIAILIVISFGIYKGFIKEEKPTFTLEKVSRGVIWQEVSETGTVKVGEEINLGFENVGRIEKIYVKVGDTVEKGQKLAEIEINQLSIQLSEAQAALEAAQAELNKLLAGSSVEEIKISQTAVTNAALSLRDTRQDLKNIESSAKADLVAAYEDALNTLDDSYLKIYNAYNTVDLIQRTYFYYSDQESLKVKENKEVIKKAMNSAKSYLNTAKDESVNENIDIALSEIKDALRKTSEALGVIREMCEKPLYSNTISASDKTSLDTQRTNINTALTNITNSQQTISSTILTNEQNIDTAKSQVSAAEGELQKAQDELALKQAEPRQVDIDLYQAQIKQAQAKKSLLEDQIQEAVLKSPVKGQITEINKREAETIQLTESLVSLIPESPFQIKVDIYEEDIVKVKTGNPVDIILVAFSDEILKGEVISVDPAEKLIGGVVYYEVTIDFEKTKEGIKPGMTADIIIESDKKENVLVIPKRTVKKMDGKKIVQVFKDGEVKEREIEIGLEGNEYIEVISGLQEGEEIVVR